MGAVLNLLKSQDSDQFLLEKRKFPRFPFSYMLFKSQHKQTFEVIDISLSGMQIQLKSGDHHYHKGQSLSGNLGWKSQELDLEAEVVWVQDQKIGLKFIQNVNFAKKIKNFLDFKQITHCMKSISGSGLELNLPANLTHWLRSDGPCEIFVWSHPKGAIARFELIIFQDYIEWRDGQGVQTGRVMQIRDEQTPLNQENELEVKIDQKLDSTKLYQAHQLIENLAIHHLPKDVKNFIYRKVSS